MSQFVNDIKAHIAAGFQSSKKKNNLKSDKAPTEMSQQST